MGPSPVRIGRANPAPAHLSSKRTATSPPAGLRQWAGIAAGAFIVVASFAAMGLDRMNDLLLALFIAAFTGGVVAGVLSRGGARPGAVSGFLSGVFGVGVIGLYILEGILLAAAAGSRFWAGMGPIVLALFGVYILPAATVGGALGGGSRLLAWLRAAEADP